MQAMFITRLCRKELCSTEYNRDQRIALERKVRKITVLNSQVWEAAILERVNSLGLKVRSRPRSKTRIQEGRNGTLETSRKLGGKLMPIGKVTQQNREERNQAWCWDEGERGCREKGAEWATEQSKTTRETDARRHLHAAQTSVCAREIFHCSGRENLFWYLVLFPSPLNKEQKCF